MGSNPEKILMTKKESILCIVPLPPPITGPAIASETIVNYLKRHYDVVVMAYQRGNLISGRFSLSQFLRVIVIGVRLMLIRKTFDCVYLVISSTFWGNLRDLFLLVMMGYSLRNKTILHLHGANIKRYLNGGFRPIKYLNKKMLGGIRHAIVLGGTFKNIFDGYIFNDKIRIVNNYFKTDLLTTEENISRKFNSPEKINILFLSNLIREKGYEVLLDAFLSMHETIRNKAMLHFAGEIYSTDEKRLFTNNIKNRPNIFYHGPVAGEEKRRLLEYSHIFCLPTFHKFEGQPISILEAYASGCIVLTTRNGGINDIFVDNSNGFLLDMDIERLKENLRERLGMLITNIDKYRHVAIFNRKEASEKYAEEVFCRKVEEVLFNSEASK